MTKYTTRIHNIYGRIIDDGLGSWMTNEISKMCSANSLQQLTPQSAHPVAVVERVCAGEWQMEINNWISSC